MLEAAIDTLEAPEVAAYLDRIGVDGDPEPTADWLTTLHVAHLHAVPFENLELHAKRPLSLEVGDLYTKIVAGRRGGFCYELNGLFAALLASVGFDLDLVSCRVDMPDGWLSPPYDHAALLVRVGNVTWLADVGFGDSFREPHPLGSEWTELGRRIRTAPDEDAWWRLENDRGEGWRRQFLLDPTPREMTEFLARCRWHETSPDSNFQRAPVATLATPDGRISISGRRLITTVAGDRSEVELETDELDDALAGHFDPEMVAAIREAAFRD